MHMGLEMAKPSNSKHYPILEIPIEQIPELKKKAPGDMCEIKFKIRVTGVRTGEGDYNNRLTAEVHGYEAYDKKKKGKAPRYENEDEE